MSRFGGLFNAVSQVKQADFQDTLSRFWERRPTVSRGAADAGFPHPMSAAGRMSNWYSSISPEARAALMRGAGGAALGGLAAGGMAAMTPRDAEDKRSILGPTLMGALLGGGAAAGLPAGLKMLSGQTRFPSEEAAIADSALSKLLYPVAVNPGAAIGGAAGAGMTFINDPLQAAYRTGWDANKPYAGHRYWAPTTWQRWKARATRPFKALRGIGANIEAAVDKTQGTEASILKEPKGTKRDKMRRTRKMMLWRGKAGLVSIPVGLILGALANAGLKGQIN
jgi:hypothetical protein